jgi:hypothetical protein
MDLYCPRCGEPWDHDTLHDVAEAQYAENGYPPFYASEEDRFARRRNPAYDSEVYGDVFRLVSQDFRRVGCVALGGECGPASTRRDPVFGLTAQEAAGALYDILGDDMDGATAELQDMGF